MKPTVAVNQEVPWVDIYPPPFPELLSDARLS